MTSRQKDGMVVYLILTSRILDLNAVLHLGRPEMMDGLEISTKLDSRQMVKNAEFYPVPCINEQPLISLADRGYR